MTSLFAVPHMIEAGKGLIVNLSFWAAERCDKGTAYCMAKAATNKMTEAMAFELKDYNVSVITIYPGLVRTESVMRSKDFFDLSNSESPEFIGRVVAALAADETVMEKSGTVQIAAQAVSYTHLHRYAGLSHFFEYRIGNMLRSHLELAADMVFAQLLQKGFVRIVDQVIKPQPGADKDFFYAGERPQLPKKGKIVGVVDF